MRMESGYKNKENGTFGKSAYLLIALVTLVSLLVQGLLLRYLPSTEVILAYNCIIASGLLYFMFIRNIPTGLLILTVFPMLYLNDLFSLSLEFILVQNIPLYLFLMLAFFKFSLYGSERKTSTSYLLKPLWVLAAYSTILFIEGFIKGAPFYWLVFEYYQHLYLFLPIPILFMINERKQYKLIFISIIAVFLGISIEYIVYNIDPFIRFTTYHNAFVPFVLGVLFAALFFYKKDKLRLWLLLMGVAIVVTGSVFTKTRMLWVADLITIVLVGYLYSKHVRKNIKSVRKYLLFFLLILIPLLFLGDQKKVRIDPRTTDERLSSISDPMGDLSFLMRVEISQLAIKKILQYPVFGEGFGFRLKFKLLADTWVTFIDSSFLYYLWKGGIVGLAIFLWLYVRFFRQCLFILKNTNSDKIKILMLGIMSSYASFIFYGIFSANLIAYKLNFLYAIMFAYVEFEKQKILDESNVKA